MDTDVVNNQLHRPDLIALKSNVDCRNLLHFTFFVLLLPAVEDRKLRVKIILVVLVEKTPHGLVVEG